MAQIVINVPDRLYEKIQNWTLDALDGIDACMFIRNGTPLPKGHGRITDMDEAIKCIKEVEGEDAALAIGLIEWACGKRTIIEADKESKI